MWLTEKKTIFTNYEKVLNHFTFKQTFTTLYCNIIIQKGKSPLTKCTEVSSKDHQEVVLNEQKVGVGGVLIKVNVEDD